MVISQNQIEPESGRTVEKQGFYSRPSACTQQMITAQFEGAVMPKSCNNWFSFCYNLTQIKNMKNLYTDECTTMYAMFEDCNSLTSLDISGWNTSQVTSMTSMFRKCSSLTNLNISKWNTSGVTNMSSIFDGCYQLKSKGVKVSQTTYDKMNILKGSNTFSYYIGSYESEFDIVNN